MTNDKKFLTQKEKKFLMLIIEKLHVMCIKHDKDEPIKCRDNKKAC